MSERGSDGLVAGLGEGGVLVSPEEAVRFADMSHKAVFGEVMEGLAREGRELSVVVSDYGRRLNLGGLRELCPDAFVQCGIAEQNQLEVASALANEGFCTFAPSYATFITARVLDQIRVNLGIMRSPVMLVGVSCGCDSAILGASHMALEDVACTRSIPGMVVASPSDNAEFAAVLRWLAANPRPAYVRMNEPLANLHPEGVSSIEGVGVLREAASPDLVLVASGTMAATAVEAAEALAGRGVETRVLGLPLVKPLAGDALLRRIAGVRLVATLEEHGVVGGLGGAVAELLADRGAGVPLLRLGMPDAYQAADTRERILSLCELDAPGVVTSVLKRLEGDRLLARRTN